MIPIKIRLMDYIRKQGGSVKNNDNRIPALLKTINEQGGSSIAGDMA